MTEPQAQVQAVLDELVGSGSEIGLQVAAYYHGDPVIDAWAGVADAATGRAVDRETLFTVYSVSKGVTATVIHLLAERGLLEYDAPIARYWPEFGANGKAGVTLRHVLTHTAGLCELPPGVTTENQCDWDGTCSRFVEQTPLWEPGSQLAYHALTFGWILGRVAERVDGRPFSRIVADEFVGPLGLDGLYFGVPMAEMGRVATLREVDALKQAPPGPIPGVAPSGFIGDEVMNRPDVRAACLPAHGLVANARSLAGLYASMTRSGLGGRRLLPDERVKLASAIAVNEEDGSGGGVLRFGLGYQLGGPDSSAGPRVTAFGHSGYGGAYALADPEYDLAIGFTKNYLTENNPGEGATWRVLGAVRDSLGVPS